MESPPDTGFWDRLQHHLKKRFRGPLRYWHLHIIWITLAIVAVVGAISFEVGRQSSTWGATQLHQRYDKGVKSAFKVIPGANPTTTYVKSLPAVRAFVNWKYADPPGDQGDLGQCQCKAFAKQYDYLVNERLNRASGKGQLHFNCPWLYIEVTGGVDDGSYIQQYVAALNNVGAIRDASWPYGNLIVWPLPAETITEAAKHRYPVKIHVISGGTGGGEAAILAIAKHLQTTHRPVNVDFPVPESYFNINATQGWQETADNFEGGHANTIYGIDTTLVHDGITCWALVSNQWIPSEWGFDRNFNYSDRHGGYAAMPCSFIAQYGFGISYLSLTSQTPGAAAPAPQAKVPPAFNQPGPALDIANPPPPSAHHGPVVIKAGKHWLYHLYTADTRQDVAPIINHDSFAAGLDPIGVAATMMTECSLFTHSTRCDRLGGGYDYSFGCCQVTVGTAKQFGVGNGIYDGYNGPNASYVRAYENNPAKGIALMVKALVYFQNVERSYRGCSIGFPQLYVVWNAGFQPCDFIYYPYGQAGGNYAAFTGWYARAARYVVYHDPYAKKHHA